MIKKQVNKSTQSEALGFVRYGYEYIEAARVVDEEAGARSGYEFVSPTPAYFLAMHGIELTLKAFLCHKGLRAKDLYSKPFGHDLHSCYRKSKELGLLDALKLGRADLKAIAMLSKLNLKQGLRYNKIGHKIYPSWAIVEPLAVRLHQAIAPLVGCKTFHVYFPNHFTTVQTKDDSHVSP